MYYIFYNISCCFTICIRLSRLIQCQHLYHCGVRHHFLSVR
jgi:hypothetical protein